MDSRSEMSSEVIGACQKPIEHVVDLLDLGWSIGQSSFGFVQLLINSSLLPPFVTIRH